MNHHPGTWYLHQVVPVELQDPEVGQLLEHGLREGGQLVAVQAQLLGRKIDG